MTTPSKPIEENREASSTYERVVMIPTTPLPPLPDVIPLSVRESRFPCKSPLGLFFQQLMAHYENSPLSSTPQKTALESLSHKISKYLSVSSFPSTIVLHAESQKPLAELFHALSNGDQLRIFEAFFPLAIDADDPQLDSWNVIDLKNVQALCIAVRSAIIEKWEALSETEQDKVTKNAHFILSRLYTEAIQPFTIDFEANLLLLAESLFLYEQSQSSCILI
jgi:hypothetical protein